MWRIDGKQTSSAPARRPPVGLPPMNTVLGKPDFTQKYNVLPDLAAARRRFEAEDDGVDFDLGFHGMHDRKQGDYPPLIPRQESGLSPQRSFLGLPGPPNALSFRSDDAGMYGQHSNGPFRNELAGFDDEQSNMLYRSDVDELYRTNGPMPFRNDIHGVHGMQSDPRYGSGLHGLHGAHSDLPLRSNAGGLYGAHGGMHSMSEQPDLRGTQSDMPFRGNPPAPHTFQKAVPKKNKGSKKKKKEKVDGNGNVGRLNDLKHCSDRLSVPTIGRDLSLYGKPSALPGIAAGSPIGSRNLNDELHNITRESRIQVEKISERSALNHNKGFGSNTNVIPGIKPSVQTEHSPGYTSSPSYRTLDDGTGVSPMTCIDRSVLTSNVQGLSLFGKSRSDVLPGITPKNGEENNGGLIKKAQSTYALNARYLSGINDDNPESVSEKMEEEVGTNIGNSLRRNIDGLADFQDISHMEYESSDNDSVSQTHLESMSERMDAKAEAGRNLAMDLRPNIDGFDDFQDISHVEYESSDKESNSESNKQGTIEGLITPIEGRTPVKMAIGRGAEFNSRSNKNDLDDFHDISHVEYESSDKESKSESNKQGTIARLSSPIEARTPVKIETGRGAEFNLRSNKNDLDDFHDISQMEYESSDQESISGSNKQGTIGVADKTDEEKSEDKVDVGGNLDLNQRPNINGLDELKDVSLMEYESSDQESITGSNKQGIIGENTQAVGEKSDYTEDSAKKLEPNLRPSIDGIDDIKDIGHMEYDSSDKESMSGSNGQDANHGLTRVLDEKAEDQIHVETDRSFDLDMSPTIDGRDDPQNACKIDYESSDRESISEPNKQGAIEELYKPVEENPDNKLDETRFRKECDNDRHGDNRGTITSDIETDTGTKESCGDTIEDEWVSHSELSKEKLIVSEERSGADKLNDSKGSCIDSPATASIDAGKIGSGGINANEVKFELQQKMHESPNHEYLLKNSCKVDMDIPKKEVERKEPKVTKVCFVTTTQNDIFNNDNHGKINTEDKIDPIKKMTGTDNTMTLETGEDTKITRITDVQKASNYENDVKNHVVETQDDSQSQVKTPTTKSAVTKTNVIVVNPEMVKRQQRKKRIARENAKLFIYAKISEPIVGCDRKEADKHTNLNRKVSFSNDPEVHIVKPVAVLKKEMKKTWKDNSSEEYTYDTDEDLDNISDDIFDDVNGDGNDTKVTTSELTRNNTEFEHKVMTKPESNKGYDQKLSTEDSLVVNHKKASEKTPKGAECQITNDLVTKHDPNSLQSPPQPSTKNEEQNIHKKKGGVCIHVPIKYGDFDISVKRAKHNRADNDKVDDNPKRSIPAVSYDEKSVKVVPDEAQATVKCKDLPVEERKVVQHGLAGASENKDDKLKSLSKHAISPETEGETKIHSNSLDVDIAYMNAIFKELDAPERRRVIAEILKLTQNPTSIQTNPSMHRLVNRRYDMSQTDQRGLTRMERRQSLCRVIAADSDDESSSATDTISEKLVYNKCRRMSNEGMHMNGTRGNRWPKTIIDNEAKRSFRSLPVAGSSRGEVRDNLQTRLSENTFSSSSFVSIARGKADPFDGTKNRRNVRRRPSPVQVNHGVEESKQSVAWENKSSGNDAVKAVVKAKDQNETDGLKKSSGGIKAFFRKLICVCKPKNDADDE